MSTELYGRRGSSRRKGEMGQDGDGEAGAEVEVRKIRMKRRGQAGEEVCFSFSGYQRQLLGCAKMCSCLSVVA